MLFYSRTATTVAQTIKKGATNKQIEIHKMILTASTAGTVVITDGSNSYTIDVVAGINNPFCQALTFLPDCDVTITPTGPSLSTFAEYTYK